jgi:dynein light chain LC8-type
MSQVDRKAVVKNADMSEDMQQDAIDCAIQALEKYNVEKDIAAFIKKEFDKKYVSHAPDSSLYSQF